jgi:hypothetical protein
MCQYNTPYHHKPLAYVKKKLNCSIMPSQCEAKMQSYPKSQFPTKNNENRLREFVLIAVDLQTVVYANPRDFISSAMFLA